MIQIIHEGLGGELDRRTVERLEEIDDKLVELVAASLFMPGDVIRIIEESSE